MIGNVYFNHMLLTSIIFGLNVVSSRVYDIDVALGNSERCLRSTISQPCNFVGTCPWIHPLWRCKFFFAYACWPYCAGHWKRRHRLFHNGNHHGHGATASPVIFYLLMLVAFGQLEVLLDHPLAVSYLRVTYGERYSESISPLSL